ncbi:MAG: hypothetical protein KME17_24735 [Cyanosarcina radialis HA8281-LM2]|jgi:hypothetical protein|nr:hypothetical protein [Cyanosarcina radialis HA8281-LM2]
MGQLIALSGTASNVNYFSKTSGDIKVRQGTGSGTIRTKHTISFRVDNKPASFPGRPDLGEGDRVTIIGSNTSGGVAALIVINHSTGIEYSNLWPVTLKNIWGGALIFIGLTFLSTNGGFAFLLMSLGVWLIYLGRQQKQTIDRLKAAS